VAAEKSRRRDRDYVRVALRLARLHDPDIAVFVKAGRDLRVHDALERFLTALADEDFRVPAYYGSAVIGDRRIAVWDFAEGERPRRFANMDVGELERVVRAAAGINSVTAQALAAASDLTRRPAIQQPLLGPDLARRMQDVDLHRGRADLPEAADAVIRNEARAVERLAAFEPQVLSQGDFGSPNITLGADGGPPTVIDWERAAIVVPGYCLRRLGALPPQTVRALVALYAERMAEKGTSLNFDDLLFTVGAVHVLKTVRLALHERDDRALRAGLRHAQVYLGDT
jgi:hypothetical protein